MPLACLSGAGVPGFSVSSFELAFSLSKSIAHLSLIPREIVSIIPAFASDPIAVEIACVGSARNSGKSPFAVKQTVVKVSFVRVAVCEQQFSIPVHRSTVHLVLDIDNFSINAGLLQQCTLNVIRNNQFLLLSPCCEFILLDWIDVLKHFIIILLSYNLNFLYYFNFLPILIIRMEAISDVQFILVIPYFSLLFIIAIRLLFQQRSLHLPACFPIQ